MGRFGSVSTVIFFNSTTSLEYAADDDLRTSAQNVAW